MHLTNHPANKKDCGFPVLEDGGRWHFHLILLISKGGTKIVTNVLIILFHLQLIKLNCVGNFLFNDIYFMINCFKLII